MEVKLFPRSHGSGSKRLQSVHRGPPRGKRDGVIRHNLERENVNWMEKLRYFEINQSAMQRDWVNLA